MKSLDLLVIGDANPDLILSGGEVVPAFGQQERVADSGTLTLGGSSTLTACAAAKLGLATAFLGVVGDDVFGRYVLDTLAERGVEAGECVIDRASPTGVTVILDRGDDRAMLSTLGTTGRLTADQIPRGLMRAARHLHCGSLFLQPALLAGLPALFTEARAAGTSTSFDTNWDPSRRWQGLEPLLAEADVFLPNEQELLGIARTAEGEDLQRAAISLSAPGRLIAVKRGSRGALACRDGELVEHPGFPAQLVDAVGAGDSFNAGFIAGMLAGEPLERCLGVACACGALSTRAVGGVAGQATMQEAMALVVVPV
jgi:sugar/nucleoside kinase (ribokinase family)